MTTFELKLRREAAELLRTLILLVTLHYWVITVKAFLTSPQNIMTRKAFANATPVTVSLSSDTSKSVDTANHKINSIRKSVATIALEAGLFGEQMNFKNQNPNYISPTSDWQVYVDLSRASLDRGGNATFDAFSSLCYTSVDGSDAETDGKNQRDVEVQVIPAIIPKPATGGKAPWIRCIWNSNKRKDAARPFPNIDISNVDSVEKVYRVLTKHLGLTDVSIEACECVKWKHKGNNFLESGEIKSAIYAYSQALEICEEALATNVSDPRSSYNSVVLKQQEGIILLLRSSAYLQQARFHKEILRMDVAGNEAKLPTSEIFEALISEALTSSSFQPAFNTSVLFKSIDDDEEDALDGTTTGVNGNDAEEARIESLSEGDDVALEIGSKESPTLSSSSNYRCDSKAEDRVKSRDNDPQTAFRLSVLRMLQSNGKLRKAQLRKIQYRHGLYQASLMQATSDALGATDFLPNYPMAWVRAGDLLSDLWQIGESKQYYEKALSIDESLDESLGPILEGLESRRELVNRARTNMMLPDDTLQLSLDVAG